MEIDKSVSIIMEEILKNSMEFIYAEFKLNNSYLKGNDFPQAVVNIAVNIYANLIGNVSSACGVDPILINNESQDNLVSILKKFKEKNIFNINCT